MHNDNNIFFGVACLFVLISRFFFFSLYIKKDKNIRIKVSHLMIWIFILCMRWIYVRKILHITVNSIFPPDSLFFFFFSLKTPKNKNLKAILCGYNAKKCQLGSFISMLIVTSLLNPLFIIFLFVILIYV